MIPFVEQSSMVNSNKGFWKTKENTNSIFTFFNSLYNFIYERKQRQMGRYFFRKPYWFSRYILNISRKVETPLYIIFFSKNFERTHNTETAVLEQHGVITFVQGNDICNFQLTQEISRGKGQIADVGQWLNQNFWRYL